jgi:SP family facilitated glucose transporter-like MFS transporter 8
MLQLPWLMIAELFPLSVRGVMSGVVSSLAYLFIFTTVKIYPNLLASLRMFGMMWVFAAFSFFVIFFARFCLPETQGRLLIEIENSFKKEERMETPIFVLQVR